MKERIDIVLVDRRLVESRNKAQWLIREGFVLVNGVEVKKPSKRVNNSDNIELKHKFPYVSKGGLKLEEALRRFSINIKNKICVDIGASVGGFTDCLLKHGALKIYAIDTATDLLHPSLRCEKNINKVIPLLGVDARELREIKEKADFCAIDVTFTSLKSILPNTKYYLKNNGEIVSLVKPLFETKFYDLNKYKIITDSERLRQILTDLLNWSIKNHFYPYGIIRSPILGKGGSIEFLVHYKFDEKESFCDYENMIRKIL